MIALLIMQLAVYFELSNLTIELGETKAGGMSEILIPIFRESSCTLDRVHALKLELPCRTVHIAEGHLP